MRFAILFALFLASVLPVEAFDPAQQDDSLALVRHFAKPPNPVEPSISQGSFVPLAGETISLMGGADVFRMQDLGYFEAMLHSAFPDKQLHVRNLGWSADTVYRQQRPMYFYTEKGFEGKGSVPDQREKVAAGTCFLYFGRMESLDGPEKLPAFEEAYGRLVSELQKVTKRIVLVGPVPFAKSTASLQVSPSFESIGGGWEKERDTEDRVMRRRNAVLRDYSESIRKVAEKRNVIFIDPGEFPDTNFDTHGLYLNESGHLHLATRVANGIGIPGKWSQELVDAIRPANRLWHQYYRPTNWAFLYGDRQHVPSSRDHKDANRRWFEEELEKIPQLILAQEKTIWSIAKGGQR